MNRDRIGAETGSSLNYLLSAVGLQPLDPDTATKFDEYLALILRWNSRMNLTAIRAPKEILSRHFVESVACARRLPEGIGTLLDFGSGAGFPGIPIALCRPEIAVTLAESQSKKAAFLQEAVRVLALNASVFAKRAEQLTQQFDCVTLRAVDRMDQAIGAASDLIKPEGWLAVLTTTVQLPLVQKSADPTLIWEEASRLPSSERRVLALASKQT